MARTYSENGTAMLLTAEESPVYAYCATAASATNSDDDAGVDGQLAPLGSPGDHEPKKYHSGSDVPVFVVIFT